MKKGDRVRAKIDITSDDQELTGHDYGDPIVKEGTLGTVLGPSEEFLEPGCQLKGEDDCFAIAFDGGGNYDCNLDEVEPI